MAGPRRRRGRQRGRQSPGRGNQSRRGRGRNLASSPNDSMVSNRSGPTSSATSNDATGRRSRSASPNLARATSSTLDSYDEDSSAGSRSDIPDGVNQDNICPICRNHIQRLAITNCNHRFCHDCIHRWASRNSTCPSCRQTIRDIRNVRPNGVVEVRHISRTEQIANRINETTSVMMVMFSLLVALLPEVASYLEQMEEIARELNLPAGTAARAQRADRGSAPGSRASSTPSSPLSPATGAAPGTPQDVANQMRMASGALVSLVRAPSSGPSNGNTPRVALRLRINRAPPDAVTRANSSGAESGGTTTTTTTAASPRTPAAIDLLRDRISQSLLSNNMFGLEAQSRAADSTDAGRVGRPGESGQTPAATGAGPQNSSNSSGLASLHSVRATMSGPNLPARSTVSTSGHQIGGTNSTTSRPVATTSTTPTTTTTTTTATTTSITPTTSTATTTTSNARPTTGSAQNTLHTNLDRTSSSHCERPRNISKIGDRNKREVSQPQRSKKRSQNKRNGTTAKNKDRDRDKDKDKDKEESSTTSRKDGTYQDIIGSLVAGKFKLIKLLGSGSYGAVYLGKNIVSAELVAVKLEHKATKAPQLPLEYRFIKMIGPIEGFPRIIRIDECAGLYHAMIMELLGPSLEEVFNICERRLSLKSVLYLTLQLLARFQTLHSKNIIYRDVKPENFLLGRPGMDKENIVHIIDYGLAKEYINPDSGTHIAFRGQRGAIGTARYMSVNTHMGKEQSRRDDLEALGYVIIYLMRGSLPWQGLPAEDHRERMRKIGDMKRRLPVEEICDRCPEEFASYLRYVKQLDFYEAPDYDYLRKLFFDVFVANRFVEDGNYDWTGKFEAKSS